MLPPFTGVAVNVTELLLHAGLEPLVSAMLTEGVNCEGTLMVIPLLVNGFGEAQVALEVSTKRMISPSTKLVPATAVYVNPFAPVMLLPFLVHW